MDFPKTGHAVNNAIDVDSRRRHRPEAGGPLHIVHRIKRIRTIKEQTSRLDRLVVSLLAPSGGVRHVFGQPIQTAKPSGLEAYCSEGIVTSGHVSDLENTGPYIAKISAPSWAKWWSGLNKLIEKRHCKNASGFPLSGQRAFCLGPSR